MSEIERFHHIEEKLYAAKQKGTRGGKRPNAGRKKADYETKIVSFRVKTDLVEEFKEVANKFLKTKNNIEYIKKKIEVIQCALTVVSASVSITNNKMLIDLTNSTIEALNKIDTSKPEAEFQLMFYLNYYKSQLQIIVAQPIKYYFLKVNPKVIPACGANPFPLVPIPTPAVAPKPIGNARFFASRAFIKSLFI